MIILFVLLNIFLAIGLAILIRYSLETSSKNIPVIKNNFWENLKKYAFTSHPSPPYPLELYIWVTSHDKNVCEDCIRRSKLQPMDIADWMKIGLPGTPEADTCCGDECRCRLVLYKTTNTYHT